MLWYKYHLYWHNYVLRLEVYLPFSKNKFQMEISVQNSPLFQGSNNWYNRGDFTQLTPVLFCKTRSELDLDTQPCLEILGCKDTGESF